MVISSNKIQPRSDGLDFPETIIPVVQGPTYKQRVLLFAGHVKKICLDSVTDATMHGLPRIVNAEQLIFLRIVWLVCCMAATAVCLLCCAKCLYEFFEYPVVTNVDSILEIPTKFP
jgi:hypothetical protein